MAKKVKFTVDNSIETDDTIKCPVTKYVGSWNENVQSFTAYQVSTSSGNVLCKDVFSPVDIGLALKYNHNCSVITLCSDRCGITYSFDKTKFVEFVEKYRILDCIS